MLLAKNKRITTKGEDMKKGFIKTHRSAFTLSECTPGGQVRSYTRVPAKGGQIQDSEREAIQPIEKAGLEQQNTGLIHVKNLFPYFLNPLFPCSKRAAFTLAEVLITLVVIGIVAVLTIPNLMQNNNQKAWDTAADVFNKRLEVAARVMNTQETLAGYSNTKDFVTELKKHIKITRICDNDELTKCFPEKVFWGAEQEEIDVEKDIKSAKNMGQDDWGTEVIGAQFANGIDALIAYDPNCTQDPYNNQIQASNCVAILYDVSAKKNPNSYGKDLRANGKVLSLGGIECAFEVAGTCYTNPALPTPMTLAECEQAVQEGTLGIKECHYDNDYWAGAVKHCGGVQNMPTPAQLAEIATDLYGDHGFSSANDETTTGLTMDKTKPYVSILNAVYGNSEFAIWSGQESDGYAAYVRGFYSDYTYTYYYNGRYYDELTVCISH